MLEYTLYILGGLFVLGFVVNQSKTKKLVNTLSKDRAKVVGIETTLTLFLRNPFYGILIVFIGLFELIRIVVGLTTEVFLILIDSLKAIKKILLQDHKSAATVYSYILVLHNSLSTEDLEKIAAEFDVPMCHLEKIRKEPTGKNVSVCTYERKKYKLLSGPALNQALLNIERAKVLLEKSTDDKNSDD